jgi:rhamnosyltransferase
VTRLNSAEGFPKIAICLAAFNGTCWLTEQLDTIIAQTGVAVTVFVSVDASTDGTEDFVNAYAQADSRIVVLPHSRYFGGASKNFFRLLVEIDLTGFDYISFADQDDIWERDKLIRHVELMQKNNVDGVSSNVIAFWPDGRNKLIDKSQPQRKLDFLFESAGPGCTYLMTPWLISEVKKSLVDPSSVANQVALHDWLIYAVCRASGRRWLIDPTPSMQYRQHSKNVLGANIGLKAKVARLKKISNGWYRQEVLKILEVSCSLSSNPQLQDLKNNMTKLDLRSRFNLLRVVPQIRRRFYDRIFLALIIIFGLF